MSTLIGQTVSHYNILEHLGGEGMGVVYKARDLKLDRTVALKFLPPDLTRNLEAKQRFICEAKAASALDHVNICTIHDLGETPEGQVFIAMACYEGETLQKMLERGPIDVPHAIALAMQIACGLGESHRIGIVHRDIKPANVIITRDGTAKIIDFGLVKLAGQVAMTKAGTRVGTPAYMSPEQVRGEEVDARTDLWSLGVTLFEMLTDRVPFAAEYEYAVLYKILNEDPDELSTPACGIPVPLQKVVARAMAKDPVDRYQSAAELLHDLAAARSGGGSLPRASRPFASVAVLPFEDMSPEHDEEYFCDGIAEELINALTHVDGLRVVARASAFSFKGKQRNLRNIGHTLGVATVLEGSVRKAGQRIRITAQLTSVEDGSALWSERYDRQLEDIFGIQDDVTGSIIEHLKVVLGPGERTNLVRRRANHHEAYNLYLRGRFLFGQRRHDSVRNSIDYYSQAASLDPAFALAYAGLAEAYEVLGSWRDLPTEFAFSEARKASETALRLDDRLAESHVTAGYVSLFCDWNWTAAEREFQRALTLNPACAEGHHMRAHFLEIVGRFELAVSEIDRSMELEPAAPAIHSCAAQILYSARQYDKAIRQAYATLEIAPTFYGLYGWIGAAYLKNGLPDSGLAALEEGLQHLPGDPRLQALYGTACAISRDTDSANAALAKLAELSREKYVDPYYTTWLLEAMGHREDACRTLEKAYEEHSGWLPWVAVDPLMDGLRSDPKYEALVRRMRLTR